LQHRCQEQGKGTAKKAKKERELKNHISQRGKAEKSRRKKEFGSIGGELGSLKL